MKTITTIKKNATAPEDPHATHAVDNIKSGAGPVVELHVRVRSHYRKLVESKVLAGIPRDLAEDTARRQIEHDHGVDVVRAVFEAAQVDREDAIATAGVASNARQVPISDRPASIPVDVRLDETKPASDL
jgi:hypothetical protein